MLCSPLPLHPVAATVYLDEHVYNITVIIVLVVVIMITITTTIMIKVMMMMTMMMMMIIIVVDRICHELSLGTGLSSNLGVV